MTCVVSILTALSVFAVCINLGHLKYFQCNVMQCNVCACVLLIMSQIITADIETCNPACTGLLMNSDHKPKTRSV